MTPRQRHPAGFSLLEMAATMVIIGILASVAVISYGQYTEHVRDSRAVTLAEAVAGDMQTWHTGHGTYLAVGHTGPLTGSDAQALLVRAAPGTGDSHTKYITGTSTPGTFGELSLAISPDGSRLGIATISTTGHCVMGAVSASGSSNSPFATHPNSPTCTGAAALALPH